MNSAVIDIVYYFEPEFSACILNLHSTEVSGWFSQLSISLLIISSSLDVRVLSSSLALGSMLVLKPTSKKKKKIKKKC